MSKTQLFPLAFKSNGEGASSPVSIEVGLRPRKAETNEVVSVVPGWERERRINLSPENHAIPTGKGKRSSFFPTISQERTNKLVYCTLEGFYSIAKQHIWVKASQG